MKKFTLKRNTSSIQYCVEPVPFFRLQTFAGVPGVEDILDFGDLFAEQQLHK